MKGNSAVIMAVIGVIVVLFVGIMVLANFYGGVALPTSTISIVNESSGTIANATTYTVAAGSYGWFQTLDTTSFSVGNATGTIGAGNYTITNAGRLTYHADDSIAFGTFLYTYDYIGSDSAAWDKLDNANNITWQSIGLLAIGIIVMAAMFILGFFGFGFGKK